MGGGNEVILTGQFTIVSRTIYMYGIYTRKVRKVAKFIISRRDHP